MNRGVVVRLERLEARRGGFDWMTDAEIAARIATLRDQFKADMGDIPREEWPADIRQLVEQAERIEAQIEAG